MGHTANGPGFRRKRGLHRVLWNPQGSVLVSTTAQTLSLNSREGFCGPTNLESATGDTIWPFTEYLQALMSPAGIPHSSWARLLLHTVPLGSCGVQFPGTCIPQQLQNSVPPSPALLIPILPLPVPLWVLSPKE